jgi:hypothetical protein
LSEVTDTQQEQIELLKKLVETQQLQIQSLIQSGTK